MNQNEYKEYKASPEESALVQCDTCGREVYEDDAIQCPESDDWQCCDCGHAEHLAWMDYFNKHGSPLNGDVTDVEITEVMDVVDPPYCADVAIEFECNGKRYSACAAAIMEDTWVVSMNEPFTDIEEITDND